MSYRHSSYRKVKRARSKVTRKGEGFASSMERHDTERVRLFYGLRPGSKLWNWGRPKAGR